jgi:pyrimidine operon attenuation protein/uracil phosphoribosyltransferase
VPDPILTPLQAVNPYGTIARARRHGFMRTEELSIAMTKDTDHTGRLILDSSGIDLSLARIAAEIVEKLGPSDGLAVLGIRRRGVHLASRLRAKLEAIRERPVLSGVLDITLYRDDLTTVSDRPTLRGTSIPFDIGNLNVVLVDDVLYTGRTIRAALDSLENLGRPRRIQLAVLIDRGHRELPIHADYVGKFVQTGDDEIVEVRLMEEDGESQVVVVKKPAHEQ